MILYFDSYITDIPLVKRHVSDNDAIRRGCKNYAMPRKVDIAKYTLASYSTYSWTHVLIRYELDDSSEYASFDEYILKLFPKAIIMHERSDSQADYKKSLQILDTFNEEWIFYSANNDHPLMTNDISVLDKLVKRADDFRDKYKFISIVYSHFSEFLNLPKKGTPFHSRFGKDSKIIEEDDLATVIVKRDGDNNSILIVNKNLFRHWFNSMDLGNDRIIRSEDIRKYFLTHNQLMVIPKHELCAHFDGYSITIGSRSEILPEQVPPLFIPPGFFENNIRIRYGYDIYKEGWVNINPAAKQYSFRDNETGTDLMWTLNDIPLFWNTHISEIDANPARDDVYLKKIRDQKYEIVKNPWKDQNFYFQRLKYLIQDIISLPGRVMRKIRKIYLRWKLHEKVINFCERKKKVFFTFHLRPAYAEGINKKTGDTHADTAMVIQGPIVKEKNFTLETVKTYIKIFPGARIILSTWVGEDTADFEKLPIDLLLNEKPKHPGISNINYQIVSTHNGIMVAKKLNVTYILKTRTDQRIYNEKALDYFKDLLTTFPIKNTKKPKGRIIATDMGTFKYRPYSISDIILFGFSNDMVNYWNLGTDARENIKYGYKNVLEWSQFRLCEVFLSASYLEKMGEKLTWSISDSWEKYVEYFCIADRALIDLYWFKYEKNKEYRNKRYNGNFMNEEFSFADWLRLYHSKDFKNAPESLLSKQIEDTI